MHCLNRCGRSLHSCAYRGLCVWQTVNCAKTAELIVTGLECRSTDVGPRKEPCKPPITIIVSELLIPHGKENVRGGFWHILEKKVFLCFITLFGARHQPTEKLFLPSTSIALRRLSLYETVGLRTNFTFILHVNAK